MFRTIVRLAFVMLIMSQPWSLWAQATNPDPPTLSRVTTSTLKLGWNMDDQATTQRVYFGPTPYFETQHDLGLTTADSLALTPSMIEPATVYYWRVDSITPHGVVLGPIWAFSVYETTATLLPVADTYTRYDGTDSSLSDQNYGTTDTLQAWNYYAGGSYNVARTWLKFVVDFYDSLDQPRVVLRIRAIDGGEGLALNGYRALPEWNETTLTYNNQHKFANIINSGESVTDNGWHESDLTALFTENTTYSLQLQYGPWDEAGTFHSRESIGNEPRLVFMEAPAIPPVPEPTPFPENAAHELWLQAR